MAQQPRRQPSSSPFLDLVNSSLVPFLEHGEGESLRETGVKTHLQYMIAKRNEGCKIAKDAFGKRLIQRFHL
jgi:hypothetical protein